MIDKNDEERLQDKFDLRYVRTEDCDAKMSKTDELFNRLQDNFNAFRLEQAKNNTLTKCVVGILSAIGVALIPVIIKILF